MEKKIRERKKSSLAVWRLFLAGFLLGILIPNILWKVQWQQKTVMSMYLLASFAENEVSGADYLIQVLKIRGSYFGLAFFCGISVFGVPLAVLGMVFMGFKIGMLLSVSILQFGLWGGAAGAGLLFPQYCIYLPVGAFYLALIYEQSKEVWKNRGLFPLKVYRYVGKACLLGLFYMLGIVLEVFCNPLVVEFLMGKLKIL